MAFIFSRRELDSGGRWEFHAHGATGPARHQVEQERVVISVGLAAKRGMQRLSDDVAGYRGVVIRFSTGWAISYPCHFNLHLRD